MTEKLFCSSYMVERKWLVDMLIAPVAIIEMKSTNRLTSGRWRPEMPWTKIFNLSAHGAHGGEPWSSQFNVIELSTVVVVELRSDHSLKYSGQRQSTNRKILTQPNSTGLKCIWIHTVDGRGKILIWKLRHGHALLRAESICRKNYLIHFGARVDKEFNYRWEIRLGNSGSNLLLYAADRFLQGIGMRNTEIHLMRLDKLC